MRKALPLFISLLFLLIPIVEAQESKVSVAEAEDYRDIKITEKGFEVKDPYALPIYEPKSTSLLPFHDRISALLNSYLESILSNFDVKEAFALRILFGDLEPILSFIGDLLSLPITLLALPFLSIGRMIKAPLDIPQFLLSAILEPILSIPADEIAIIERFAGSLKDLFYLPSSLLKPIELLVYNPDPLAFLASFSLPSFSAFAITSKICRAIDFVPVLNIVKGFLTAYLLPLIKALTSPFLSLFSPYRDLLNIALFPFSLSFILVRGIGSLIKDLLSLLCMPLLFLLRAPLTPLLILFNFVKHSLEGLKEFLRFFSLLVPAFPILLFLSFIPSVLISLLLSSGILLISLALSIAITLFLSALLSAIAFFPIFLGGLILALLIALVACFISIMAGALTGLILGAAAGLLAGGIIGAVIGAAAGLIIGAVVGAVAAGALGLLILLSSGIAILPLAIAIFVALLPTVWGALVSALGGAGAALIVGIITAVVMLAAGAVIGLIIGGPLGALIGGAIGLLLGIIIGAASGLVIGAVAGLILGIISAFLLGAAAILLTILSSLLISLIAGIAGLFTGSLLSLALMAVALLNALILLPFSTLALSAICSGISLLPLLVLALISVISPEIFRVIVPPELIELSKRIALLPKDIARVINGLAHLPFDLMRAIAVLDDPVYIPGSSLLLPPGPLYIISNRGVPEPPPPSIEDIKTVLNKVEDNKENLDAAVQSEVLKYLGSKVSGYTSPPGDLMASKERELSQKLGVNYLTPLEEQQDLKDQFEQVRSGHGARYMSGYNATSNPTFGGPVEPSLGTALQLSEAEAAFTDYDNFTKLCEEDADRMIKRYGWDKELTQEELDTLKLFLTNVAARDRLSEGKIVDDGKEYYHEINISFDSDGNITVKHRGYSLENNEAMYWNGERHIETRYGVDDSGKAIIEVADVRAPGDKYSGTCNIEDVNNYISPAFQPAAPSTSELPETQPEKETRFTESQKEWADSWRDHLKSQYGEEYEQEFLDLVEKYEKGEIDFDTFMQESMNIERKALEDRAEKAGKQSAGNVSEVTTEQPTQMEDITSENETDEEQADEEKIEAQTWEEYAAGFGEPYEQQLLDLEDKYRKGEIDYETLITERAKIENEAMKNQREQGSAQTAPQDTATNNTGGTDILGSDATTDGVISNTTDKDNSAGDAAVESTAPEGDAINSAGG